MKYLIFGSVVIASLVVGFFLGRMTINTPEPENLITDRTIIRDTVIKEKTIQIVQSEEEEMIEEEVELDTTLVDIDSLNQIQAIEDSLSGLSISREILIKSESLPIAYLNEEPIEGDSILRESLGIKTNKNKYISVEYWQSPLNYEGYKLSKGKLILYGVPSQFEFEFVKNGDKNFFASDEISYALKESEEFMPLEVVAQAIVYAD